MEQAAGIEPVLSAWEAEVLPLNYACKKHLVWVTRFELVCHKTLPSESSASTSSAIPT